MTPRGDIPYMSTAELLGITFWEEEGGYCDVDESITDYRCQQCFTRRFVDWCNEEISYEDGAEAEMGGCRLRLCNVCGEEHLKWGCPITLFRGHEHLSVEDYLERVASRDGIGSATRVGARPALDPSVGILRALFLWNSYRSFKERASRLPGIESV